MSVRMTAALLTVALMAIPPAAFAADEQLEAELQELGERVEGFAVIELPAAGELTLTADQALTADDLRGVTLDDSPPVLADRPEGWDERMVDDWPAGEAPYAAEGIAPFRFDYFTNEFSYGGWHNWYMHEYAVTHGFSVLFPYNHAPDDWPHLPEGTDWLKWGGFVNWHTWMDERGIGERQFQELAALDVPSLMLQEQKLANDPQFDQLMIDMEHGLLKPEQLREQEWYPAQAPEAERAAFEKRYYDGYAQTYVAPVEAARQNGWRELSVYGWEPFGRRWWGLDEVVVDPETDWAWNAFGKQIYASMDILNPSVYCFYWSPQNVAYTLANIDLNMRFVDAADERKRMRAYYWNLLHGGGAEKRWWTNQPLPDEDMRAMTTMCFFTGSDGMVLWSWSGTGDHHRPQIEAGKYVMVGEGFERAPEAGGEAVQLARYAVLLVDALDEDGTVRFRPVTPGTSGSGVPDDAPSFAIPREELEPLLRPASAPIAALVEGLALVKPLEYLLSHGEAIVDVPAQEQFAETLPIVRRVELDGYHAIASYDPLARDGGEARSVTIDVAGRTVTVPTDAQVRVFVVRAPQ